ncbi:MAG: beta strand repeat-containing protein, partial [Rubripirellula sp.]
MTLTRIRGRLGLPSRVYRSDSRERGKVRQNKLRRQRRRSILEHLEDRRVLATYMVTSLADSGAGSLRDALQSANATGVADAIVFDAALAGTINLGVANGALQITSPVSIQGPGSGSMTVDANATPSDKFRVFEISDAANDVSISGLTLTGGMVDDGGGGILFRSADTLTLVDTVVTGNQASNGGGIYSEYEGAIVLQSSSVSGNTAESAKGGGIHAVDGDVTLTDSTISGNYSYSDGAGIFSQYAGNISITDSQVANNKVTEAGYHGGGIYGANGDITITGSTITGNESKGDGGGVYSYKGSFTISNTTITGNSADYGGGGVFNYEGDLTITSSVFTNNNADYGSGGGIGNTAGRLTISGTRITDNQAVGNGGGVATNNGLVDISDSLIASNTATIDGGGIASAVGVVLVTNSTISGNTSTGRGGGIQADAAAVRLVHVTLAFNSTGSAGGGIGVVDDSTGESLLIYNSIVASNTATTGPDIHIPNDPGTVLDIQSSLISNNTDSTLTASAGDANGNVIGSAASPVDPNLSALANNGGATNTHDLSYISPATDAANLALSLYFGVDGNVGGGDDIALTTDQRSGLYSRNAIGLAAGPDMGALEKQARPSLIVDTTADVVNGDLSPGDRSFREMLSLANEDLGDDEISFSLTLPPTISLDSALGSLVIEETLSVFGPGADRLTIQNVSGQAFRIFDIQGTTAQASFYGLTLTGGDAGIENGGAIRSEAAQLHLFEVELLGNSAASGGGVAVNAGNLSIVSTTIAGNNVSANGGGVAALDAVASLVVLNSTVSGNTAVGDGGGVYSQNTPVALSNSTVAFNTAGTGGGVGLLADDNGESLSLKNSIVAANTATSAADFLAPLDVANDLDVVFSLVGDNDGTSLVASSFTGDQPMADGDGNLIGGGAGPLVDPGLESLADQGGTTQTHALLPSSFAVDAGDRTLLPQDTYDVDVDNNFIEFLPVDQRGDPAERVVNDLLDMGAFELPPAVVIDWATPAPIVYGTALSGTQLNASPNDGGQPSSSPVLGSFIYAPSTGAVLQAGDAQTLTTTFTPNELREFRVTEATVAINVSKADPIIDWSDPADIVYLTPLSSTQFDAVEQSGLAGSFDYTPATGTILSAGNDQTLSVTFIPADNDNFNNATADVLIDVLRATPSISWSNPAAIPYGTPLSATQLNATADGDLPGTFVYDPSAGTVLDVGVGQTLSVEFFPTESLNYNTVSASVDINVVKADPVLSWPDPDDIVYGTPLSGTQLNATVSGGVSGDFVYTPDTEDVLSAGADQLLSVVFTPTGIDATRYNEVSDTAEITVVMADPSITWNDPAAIPNGTLLSGTQLNATADITGSFAYAPDVGAQLGVGNGQTLSLTFTPDDDNYNTAVDSVTIDVLPNQAPSFTASDPPAISEDAGAQAVTGFISGFDAGAGEASLQSVLAYQVSSIGYPGMFVSLPSVTNAGVLTYEIVPDVFGEAT